MLDDSVYSEARAPLIPFADIVKVEVMNKESTRAILKALEPYDVTLLAEKVFQGYFLCKPEVVVGEKLPANRTDQRGRQTARAGSHRYRSGAHV